MAVPAARLLVAVVPLLACGCASLYRQPPPNVALFEREGEVQVGGQVGTNGLGVSAAWAPLPRLGLIAGGWGWKEDDSPERRLEGELGVGTWFADPGGLRGAVYAGVGLGRVKIRDEMGFDLDLFGEDDPVLDGLLQRGFLQFEAGQVDRYWGFGAAGRVAAVRFDPEGVAGPGRSALTFEPALFVRGGRGWLQSDLLLGYRFVARGELPGPHENPVLLSLGIRLVFDGAD